MKNIMIDDKYKKPILKVKRIENFKHLMDEIKPFIKPKKYIRYSTDGKWTLTRLLVEEENI